MGASFSPQAPPETPVVQVLSRQTIGAYDTVVLSATPGAPGAASAVVTWLNSEGFITNDSMAPYMAPYLADGMVFVAAKLVPGAGVDEIRPLKMRYPGTMPMIPLRLTAVAAEPHLPVSAIIYANELFQPVGLPLIKLDASQITNDSFNRVNYPMLLTRSIEDAGAGAFVAEYSGPPPTYQDPTGCCSRGTDWCGVGGDGQCQCPTASFDASDCADQEDIVGAVTTAQDLAGRFTTVTRLTTRMSPEEMDFDLQFEPLDAKNGTFYPNGPLTIRGNRNTLTQCATDIIDDAQYKAITTIQDCSSMYCGQGTCVATGDGGMGCACNDGFVGRKFTDMDGKPSITCVPSVGTVDLSAGGIEIPDVCASRGQLTSGTCNPVGGFVTAACDPGFAAVLNTSDLPGCSQITASSDSPGGLHMTKDVASIKVCAPPAPRCSSDGWLVRLPVSIKGEQCSPAPDPSWFVEPPAPTCPTSSSSTGTSGAFPNNATTSSAGSSSTTEPRPATSTMMDTTAPRPGSVAPRSKGCALASNPGRTQGAIGAALAAVVLGYAFRRRSGLSRA
jgi:hypothetical protein